MSSTSALLRTRGWWVVTYAEVKPNIARTLAAVSSSPLCESIPLYSLNKPSCKTFYELKDGINLCMAASFSSMMEKHSNVSAPNRKRFLARSAPLAWIS